jgi:hypothetical protein
MLGRNRELAAIARRFFDKRHAGDPPIKEPAIPDECFEGCPKRKTREMPRGTETVRCVGSEQWRDPGDHDWDGGTL